MRTGPRGLVPAQDGVIRITTGDFFSGATFRHNRFDNRGRPVVFCDFRLLNCLVNMDTDTSVTYLFHAALIGIMYSKEKREIHDTERFENLGNGNSSHDKYKRKTALPYNPWRSWTSGHHRSRVPVSARLDNFPYCIINKFIPRLM